MIAKKYSSQIEKIKDNIQTSYENWMENSKRFNEFVRFVFDTSISDEDNSQLEVLQKPNIEFNILEAIISRLMGEFAKHQPDITVKSAPGTRVEDLTDEFLATQEVIEAHLREIFSDTSNDAIGYRTYRDSLSGGYSVWRISTDYINELSFEQNIKVGRVFDPTMAGFDPLARLSHKGDGEYCFELIPMSSQDFEDKFGKDKAKEIKYSRSTNIGGFNWSYEAQNTETVLIAEYYCKVKKEEEIIKLSNGHVILEKHYEQMLLMWSQAGYIEQPPIPISRRKTTIETIEQFIVCENGVLEHQKTNFKHLPLVFIDGNSAFFKESENGAAIQMTRPIIFHTKGAQRLINFAGQTQAAEIENIVMHKFIVPLEAIPKGYEDAYKNVQVPSNLIYNAFYKENPDQPIPPPREIQRAPTPPIVENTFMGTNRIVQMILGSYDSVLGTNDKQISGVAIQQGAMQSDATAIPYLEGYINGLNRAAEIVVDLIPKYYVTPRSLPIKQKDGKRSFQLINMEGQQDSIDMKYNPNSLQIKVEAGVSSGVKKQVALEQITSLSQAIPIVGEFISEFGLETIIDNMDIRGVEILKAQAVKFMEMRQQQKEAQAQQPSPEIMQMEVVKEIEMAKVEQQATKAEGDLAIATAKLSLEQKAQDIKFMEVMAKIEEGNVKLAIEQEKVNAEQARSAVELAINMAKQTMMKENTK
jgi:hypothetical protein